MGSSPQALPNHLRISHLYRKGIQPLPSTKKYLLTASCFIYFVMTVGAGTDFQSMKSQTGVDLREGEAYKASAKFYTTDCIKY